MCLKAYHGFGNNFDEVDPIVFAVEVGGQVQLRFNTSHEELEDVSKKREIWLFK